MSFGDASRFNSAAEVVGNGTLCPVVNICDDGQIDAAVLTENESIFIFKDYHFFELKVQDNDLIAVDNGTFVSSLFAHYPLHTKLAFSIVEPGHYLNGFFVFIRVRREL